MRFRGNGRHFATAIKVWFGSLKKFNQIAVVIISIHIFLVFFMTIDHWLTFRPSPRPSMIVHTIQPQIAPVRITPSSQSNPKPIAPPQNRISTSPTTPSPSKNKPVSPSSNKSPRPKVLSSKKETKKTNHSTPSLSIPEETIQKIEKGLTTLSSSPKTISKSEIHVPEVLNQKSITSTQAEIETSTKPNETTYHLSLIEFLQSSLQLPEVGQVRLKITLSSPGIISSIQILNSKSEKNAQWLKTQLPLLDLPSFPDFGIVDNVLEFTITFSNAEYH